jgi:hypothetical protein
VTGERQILTHLYDDEGKAVGMAALKPYSSVEIHTFTVRLDEVRIFHGA